MYLGLAVPYNLLVTENKYDVFEIFENVSTDGSCSYISTARALSRCSCWINITYNSQLNRTRIALSTPSPRFCSQWMLNKAFSFADRGVSLEIWEHMKYRGR